MNGDRSKHKPVAEPVSVYTIGQSDHPMEVFIELLRRHQLAAVVDVRSQPYSQWVPQFNREALARALEAAGVHYTFMGDSLGGRPTDRTFYEPGQEHPNYDRLRASPAFQSAVDELLALACRDRVAIMCSEADHTKCHRTKLIAPALRQRGARVQHIAPDGTVREDEPEPQQLVLL